MRKQEQNVINMNTLKTILILTITFFSQCLHAQEASYSERYKKLFLIDDLSNEYDLKKYIIPLKNWTTI